MAGNMPLYDFGLRWHVKEFSLLAVVAYSLFLFLFVSLSYTRTHLSGCNVLFSSMVEQVSLACERTRVSQASGPKSRLRKVPCELVCSF